MPELLGPMHRRVELLYRFLVSYFRATRKVVNVNEDMSCSRLRSFMGG